MTKRRQFRSFRQPPSPNSSTPQKKSEKRGMSEWWGDYLVSLPSSLLYHHQCSLQPHPPTSSVTVFPSLSLLLSLFLSLFLRYLLIWRGNEYSICLPLVAVAEQVRAQNWGSRFRGWEGWIESCLCFPPLYRSTHVRLAPLHGVDLCLSPSPIEIAAT